jgi:hypothetical protein
VLPGAGGRRPVAAEDPEPVRAAGIGGAVGVGCGPSTRPA